MACLVIHQTKPTYVGIHHAKGLWDRSTYKGDTWHICFGTNFWTHCISRPPAFPMKMRRPRRNMEGNTTETRVPLAPESKGSFGLSLPCSVQAAQVMYLSE